MSVSERIKSAREDRGVSKSKLAKAAKMHRESVIRLERGDYASPNTPTLQRLARVLGVRWEWLATGEGARDVTSE